MARHDGLHATHRLRTSAVDQLLIRRRPAQLVADVRMGGTHLRVVECNDHMVDLERHSGGSRRRNACLDHPQHDRLHVVPLRFEKGPQGPCLHNLCRRLDLDRILVHHRRILVAVAGAGQRILTRHMGRAVVRIHGHLRRFAVGTRLQPARFRGPALPLAAAHPGSGRRAASGRFALHRGRVAAARPGDGPRKHHPTQCGLLRQVPRRRLATGAQPDRPDRPGALRRTVHPAPRDGRTRLLLGAGTLDDTGRQRRRTVLAGTRRLAPHGASRCAADRRSQHPAPLRGRHTEPHGTPQPGRRQLLRHLQLGRGTRLRRTHPAAPQGAAGHRRGEHPDMGLRRVEIPGYRPGRHARADRHGAARDGL